MTRARSVVLVALLAWLPAHAEEQPAATRWMPPPIAPFPREPRPGYVEPPPSRLLITLDAGAHYRRLLGFDLFGGDFAFLAEAQFRNGFTVGGGLTAALARTPHGLVGTQFSPVASVGAFVTDRLHLGATFGLGGVWIGHGRDLTGSAEIGLSGDLARFGSASLFAGAYGGATLLMFTQDEHNKHGPFAYDVALRFGVRFRPDLRPTFRPYEPRRRRTYRTLPPQE